jgi:hypothetical protein
MLERITNEIGVEREREVGRIKEACGKGGRRSGNGRIFTLSHFKRTLFGSTPSTPPPLPGRFNITKFLNNVFLYPNFHTNTFSCFYWFLLSQKNEHERENT